jgi:ATP-binding cassette subfamily B (MDR/TAP) protein 1
VSDSYSPKYKARIVAKGFRQEYDVDFDEDFSPVGKMTTLRFLLGIVTLEDLELRGDLNEDIYMEQPQGFASPDREHLVCRLRKSLYGLKTSSEAMV